MDHQQCQSNFGTTKEGMNKINHQYHLSAQWVFGMNPVEDFLASNVHKDIFHDILIPPCCSPPLLRIPHQIEEIGLQGHFLLGKWAVAPSKTQIIHEKNPRKARFGREMIFFLTWEMPWIFRAFFLHTKQQWGRN